MNVRLSLIVSSAAIAGCAPAPVDPKASVLPAAALTSDGTAGQATIHAIFPCHVAALFSPSAITPSYSVMIDDKPAAKILPCQYREISVPAGKHAIRLSAPMSLNIFDNSVPYALPNGQQLYLVAIGSYNGYNTSFDLREVNAAEGREAIARIKENIATINDPKKNADAHEDLMDIHSRKRGAGQ